MSKLMDEVKNALRVQGYAYKTEKQYLTWIRRYVRFHLPKHPRTGEMGRHHIFETSLQRAVKDAVRKAGILKSPVGVHTLRHCFATHLYRAGTDIYRIKELLGHSKIETTMIYVHMDGGTAVRSPMDRLVAVNPLIQRVVVES